MQERLQKILAAAGVASRRQAEQLITDGRVSVNGVIVTVLGEKADVESDTSCLDGRPLSRKTKPLYYLFHKPRNVVTTLNDPQGRSCLADYLSGMSERVYPVGRLDYSSEGLLLLTNDGELTNRLLHPRYHATKTYRVIVDGRMNAEAVRAFQSGVELEDGKTAPAVLQHLRYDAQKEQTTFELILREGRNRQIRRMCQAVGLSVVRLIRIAMSFLLLDGLSPGRMRPLTTAEIMRLRREAGIND